MNLFYVLHITLNITFLQPTRRKYTRQLNWFELVHSYIKRLNCGTSSYTVNNLYISYGCHGYSRIDTHYHSIIPVDNKAHDKDDECLANPYFNPIM